jgi:uncharacterized protein YgiM (DUF1202 family)
MAKVATNVRKGAERRWKITVQNRGGEEGKIRSEFHQISLTKKQIEKDIHGCSNPARE